MKIKTTFFLSFACLLTLSGYAEPRGGNIGPGSSERVPTPTEADPLVQAPYFDVNSNPRNSATMRYREVTAPDSTVVGGMTIDTPLEYYYGNPTSRPDATYANNARDTWGSPAPSYTEGERWALDLNPAYYDNPTYQTYATYGTIPYTGGYQAYYGNSNPPTEPYNFYSSPTLEDPSYTPEYYTTPTK